MRTVRQPKEARFSFSGFRIIKLIFSINPKHKSRKTIKINSDLSVGSKFKKKEKTLFLFLKVEIKKGNIPFFIEIEAEGRFRFDAMPDKDSLNRISSVNAPAIMYPFLREAIADITRRAGFAPLHLAPFNFVKLAEKSLKKH